MDNTPNNNNDNSWLPSKEDVALVNYAIEKAHPNKTKLKKRLDIDIRSIEQGTYDDPTLYIRVLAYCVRMLVPHKMKISKLPPSEREEIEKLMKGKVNTISAYKEMILTLGRMPDLPPKHHYHPYHSSILKTNVTRSTYQRTGFNSDFEYGITDT